jgi:beta-galactosidase GanA
MHAETEREAMKTRIGFVSNSSSSSFVVITTKSSHEKALSQLKASSKFKDAVEIINRWSVSKTIGKEELILTAGHRYEDGLYSYSHEFTGLETKREDVSYEDYDEIDNVSSVLYEYEKIIIQDCENTTTLHMNC